MKMSELIPCPFHNCDTCGCHDTVDIPDAQWNTRPREAALEARVKELSGSTYCAYCGERFPLDAPDSAALVGKHIHTCEKHPIRHYIKRANELESRVTLLEGIVRELVEEGEKLHKQVTVDGWTYKEWTEIAAKAKEVVK
jgi:hypothetical protein